MDGNGQQWSELFAQSVDAPAAWHLTDTHHHHVCTLSEGPSPHNNNKNSTRPQPPSSPV